MDLSAYDDLDSLGTELNSPLDELEQDNYHDLITSPAGNPDDRERGIGLPQLLSSSGVDQNQIKTRIEAGLKKDPRNAVVRAIITPLAKGVYDIDIQIEPDPEELGTVENDLVMQLRASGSGVVFR